MKNGGLIPWNFPVYCGSSKTLHQIGKIPYERRFEEPFSGRSVLFGSIEYHPISSTDKARLHQVGTKVLPGIFVSYELYAGGIWKGHVLVADVEELEFSDATEIYARRLNAEEVLSPKER